MHVDRQQLWQQERLPLPFAESAMTSDGRLTWIFDSEPWNLTLALASPFLLRCLLICRSNILKTESALLKTVICITVRDEVCAGLY